MAVYNKYHKEVYQVSYNGGASWEDVSPAQYRKGTLMQLNSPDCTPPPTGACFTIVPIDNDMIVRFTGHYYGETDHFKLYWSYNGGNTWETWDISYTDCMEAWWLEIQLGKALTISADTCNEYDSLGYISVFDYIGGECDFGRTGRFYIQGDLSCINVGNDNYRGMFAGNTNLISAEYLILPAPTKANQYQGLFSGCTSLEKGPELSGDVLTEGCYSYMFSGCTSLNYIKCLATDISATNCTTGWVDGVSPTGTFIRHCNNFDWTRGTSGIPSNWTVNCEGGTTPSGYTAQYFTLEALENGSFSFSAQSNSSTIEYSLNSGSTWTVLSNGSSTPTVSYGSKIMWKGNLRAITYYGSGQFSSTGRFSVEGNVMSLLYGDDFIYARAINQSYALEWLFRGCTGLTSAENMVLPATALTDSCYSSMFSGCTSLTTAPSELPATTMTSMCYDRMFESCSALTGVSSNYLPATTLADNCYCAMFWKCSSLRTAPDLPATTMASGCYQVMFGDCTSLTTAPALPATTLATTCYYFMFDGCTSLTTVPSVLPATALTSYCYYSMFSECTSLATAPALPATTLADHCYGSMLARCPSLITAPDLPATVLTESCYSYMFQNCSSLNYVKCLATNVSATKCTEYWLVGTASGGTFIKNSSMNSWSSGSSGIPSGWTIQNA